ncbi:MAG: hypothetical protein IPK76_09985 [Lewinellaceae bacterium]|nr:hypothetical protein [Lewinellaceae bacterium]
MYATGLLSLVATTGIVTLSLLLAAQPIADLLHYSANPEYIRWFALILAFDCLSELPFARLRLEQRPRRFVAGKLLNIGINITLTLFWLVFCPGRPKTAMNWSILCGRPT